MGGTVPCLAPLASARRGARTPAWREMQVAVVGAGLAGLTAARRLADAGAEVTVFDKGRGLGGRLATRRRDQMALDHGAPWVEADDAAFAEALAALGARPLGDGRWVGTPGMSDLVRPLAGRPPGAPAGRDRRRRGRPLRAGGVPLGPFDRILPALPAPQVRALMRDDAAVPSEAVAMDPVWTLLVLPGPRGRRRGACRGRGRLALRSDDGRAATGRMAGWSMPARDWSRGGPRAPARGGGGGARRPFGPSPGGGRRRVPMAAHRWRYARTATALGQPFVGTGGRVLSAATGRWGRMPRAPGRAAAPWRAASGMSWTPRRDRRLLGARLRQPDRRALARRIRRGPRARGDQPAGPVGRGARPGRHDLRAGSPFRARKIGAALVARNAAGAYRGAARGHGRRLAAARLLLARRPAVGLVRVDPGADRLAGRDGGGRLPDLAARWSGALRAPWPGRVVVLDGNTGTGKTELLARLAGAGTPGRRPRGAGGHRGSLFGGDAAAAALAEGVRDRAVRRAGGARPDAPVFWSRPSRARSASCSSRRALWKAMRAAPRIAVEAPLEARARYLVEAYADVRGRHRALARA